MFFVSSYIRNICISEEEFLNQIHKSNEVKESKAYEPKTQQLSTQACILHAPPNLYQALNKDGTFDFNNIFFLLFDSLFRIDSKKLKLFSFLFHES